MQKGEKKKASDILGKRYRVCDPNWITCKAKTRHIDILEYILYGDRINGTM